MTKINNKNARIDQQNIDSTVHNHYYGRAIRKFLTKPPFLPEAFLGRTDDLQTVRRLLFEEANMLLLVNGRGGVGKTSLAAQYFHNHHQEYKHLAWVYTENNLTDALLALAVALDLKFDDQIPLENRLPLLLKEMANLDKPCLLVIDNANNPQELKNHYLALRSCPNFHLLLTTRITEFAQAKTHKIEGLPKDEAKSLFKQHYPLHDEAEDALLEQIYDAVWGNTLVLELLAKNLNNFNNKLKKRYTLHDLLKDLQEKGLLQVQSKQVKATYQAKEMGLREETPEDIITAMYELNELTQPEQKALSIFSVLPAESIDFDILQGLLKDWTDLDQCLLGLAQKGWLEEADGTFKVSPVIQEITKKKQPDLLEDCRELINALTELLKYEPGTGHLINISYQEAFLMVRYGSSIVDNIAQADNDLTILCERIGRYYRTTGNLQQAMTFFEQRSKIGQELFEAYPDNVSFKNGLAISYWKLGDYHRQQEKFKEAIQYFQLAEKLWAELATTFPDYVQFQKYWDMVKKDLEELQS